MYCEPRGKSLLAGHSAYSVRHKGTLMTDEAYVAAYQKLSDQYENNQSTMEDYLNAIQRLKDQYLKGRTGVPLPVVP